MAQLKIRPLQPPATHERLDEPYAEIEVFKAKSRAVDCYAGLARLFAWPSQSLMSFQNSVDRSCKFIKAYMESSAQSGTSTTSKGKPASHSFSPPTPSVAELTVVMPYLAARAACPARKGQSKRHRTTATPTMYRSRCTSKSIAVTGHCSTPLQPLSPVPMLNFPKKLKPVPDLVGFPRRVNSRVVAEEPTVVAAESNLISDLSSELGRSRLRRVQPLVSAALPWAALHTACWTCDSGVWLRYLTGFMILIFCAMITRVFVVRT